MIVIDGVECNTCAMYRSQISSGCCKTVVDVSRLLDDGWLAVSPGQQHRTAGSKSGGFKGFLCLPAHGRSG